jgi:hypothetical protein
MQTDVFHVVRKCRLGHSTQGSVCRCGLQALSPCVGVTCAEDGQAHRRPHEEGFIVIDVLQGHLQRLHGFIWHWLAQIAGHQDELEAEKHGQRGRLE